MDNSNVVKNLSFGKFTFRKYERINKKKEIDAVITNGKKFFEHGLLVYILKTNRNYSRIAILVSSKVEKSAVIRNKFKRRIREIFRLNKHKIKFPVDIVVIATKLSVKQKYDFLEKSFIKILDKNRLLNQ
jgi:ribonuclease P protein component